MQPARLRSRVTLQRRVETQNAFGEVTWSWADVAELWADVETIAGKEYFAAAQVQGGADTKIRLRYRQGITEKMRITRISEYGSPIRYEKFDILTVINCGERNKELMLMCKRAGAEGFAYDGSA